VGTGARQWHALRARALDALAQISGFRKLKLANCASIVIAGFGS
jgi:hypothetical protein